MEKKAGTHKIAFFRNLFKKWNDTKAHMHQTRTQSKMKKCNIVTHTHKIISIEANLTTTKKKAPFRPHSNNNCVEKRNSLKMFFLSFWEKDVMEQSKNKSH